MRKPRLETWVVACVLAGAILSAAILSAAAEEPSQATLDRIQRECLRAYPPELLAPMAAGTKTIPAAVEADPETQMQFLSKELALEKGLFYPCLLEDVLPAFQQYLKPGSRFLDLGSGDGRALFLANLLGAHAVGIEYDPVLVKVHRRAQKALKDLLDKKRVQVVAGDFFKESWSGYDVIFYFDMSSFEGERVREKLRREMDEGAVLLVNYEQDPFPGLETVDVIKPITVYRKAPSPPAE